MYCPYLFNDLAYSFVSGGKSGKSLAFQLVTGRISSECVKRSLIRNP
jgi:hypothetical protein